MGSKERHGNGLKAIWKIDQSEFKLISFLDSLNLPSSVLQGHCTCPILFNLDIETFMDIQKEIETLIGYIPYVDSLKQITEQRKKLK